jgi:aspartyl-tRNA(Asn)/glutamyl-tRNA(Gln) amidotransferase subunit A
MELADMTIHELRAAYSRKEARPSEVIEACLRRIDSRDDEFRAFLHVFHDEAMKRAAGLDDSTAEGRPLYGIPVAVKDNICTRGFPTTCASRMLEDYRPPYDATVVRSLTDAGAVIVGKTNLDEFGMGSSTENSSFGATRNPWSTDHAPGGSSGGSAAAVAAGMVPLALGSDTGGSIRQPASLCGVTGLKGTYGRVSRYGLVAFASSFDQIGPITRNVTDCALSMMTMAGCDARDATTLQESVPDLADAMEGGLAGMRIAVPSALAEWELEETVRARYMQSIEEARQSGAVVREVELPDMNISIACYYTLANAEASSNLARYDGVRYGFRADAESLIEMYERTRGEGFGEEVKRRILLGTYVLSAGYYDAYYSKARDVQELIREQYLRVFADADLILLPTSPAPAFRLGEKSDDPIAMYLSDIFTTPANITGLPAISLPAGLAPGGLPVGMQLMAGPGEEAKLFRGAAAFERIYRFRERCGNEGLAPENEGSE